MDFYKLRVRLIFLDKWMEHISFWGFLSGPLHFYGCSGFYDLVDEDGKGKTIILFILNLLTFFQGLCSSQNTLIGFGFKLGEIDKEKPTKRYKLWFVKTKYTFFIFS